MSEQNPNPFTAPFEYKRLAASIARDMGIEPDDVMSSKRLRECVHARAIFGHFLLERRWSLSRISRLLGMDHSTVIYARDHLPIYVKYYPEARECFERHEKMRDEAREAATC